MNDSMHHEHDLELIASLATGRLEDPVAAEQQVQTCPECADVYRSHVTVLEAVASEPAPTLDDIERRRLHAAVWNEMGGDWTRLKKTSPWWYRLAPVAAALVVVVGVGSIVVTGGGGETAGRFDAADADAMAEFQTTNEADAGAADGATPDTTAAASQDAETLGGDAAVQPEADAEAADTTSASENTTPGRGLATQPIVVTSDELEQAATEFAERVATNEDVMALAGQARRCLEENPDLDGPFLASEEALVDDAPALFIAQGDPGDVSRVIVFATDTCQVLHTNRP